MHLSSTIHRLHQPCRATWQMLAVLCVTLLISVLIAPALAAPSAVEAKPDRAEPSLGTFLDAEGHLQLPPGFGGSVNPAGYRIVSGEGEALRFAPEAKNASGGEWAGIGGIDNGCNGTVVAVVIGGAGEVYVGGDFTVCGAVLANRVARFDTITQVWSSLGSGPANGLNGAAFALVVSGNAVYVGGAFTQAGGMPANRVARFDTSTQTWSSIGSGTANGVSSGVSAITIAGSTLYVGGSFTQAGGVPANRVARYDLAAQSWSSLGSGAANGVNSTVNVLAVSGSALYVGGRFTAAGGALANRVARFDINTQTWSSLGSGVTNGVNQRVDALIVSGGMLYVGGDFTNAGGIPASRVARFDTGTQTWSSLGSGVSNGVNAGVEALAVSGNTLYVGGVFTQAGGVLASYVARFDISTQTWSSLGSGAANGVQNLRGGRENNQANSSPTVSVLAVSDSAVYVAGYFTQAGGAPVNRVARFNTGPRTWSSLGSGAGNGLVGEELYALAVSGSAIYVGGYFSQAGRTTANNVARFDASTQTWSSLGSGAANGVDDVVYALSVVGSSLYVGGGFIQAGGAPANGVARFDTSTQTWSSLGSGAANGVDGNIRALVVSGNTVYAGGFFTEAGGAPANHVARFDMTTQRWSSLDSGAANGVDDEVYVLAVSGSILYAGGFFTEAGGAPANRVARFDMTTQRWSSLGSGAANGVDNEVYALAVSGSILYVGGFFTEAGGAPANHVARFDTSTQTWSSLGSGVVNGANDGVHALVISGSMLYVGGFFTEAGGAPANAVARFDTSTQTWSSLGSGAVNGVNNPVFDLAIGTDGTLHVAGAFGSAGGQVSAGLAFYRDRPANHTGTYWNPQESGHGLFVVQAGNTLVPAWYTYDTDGKPLWFLVSGAVLQADGSYAGEVFRYTGSPFNLTPANAVQSTNRVGTARFRFNGNAVEFQYTINNQTQTRNLVKFDIAPSTPLSCAPTTSTRSNATNYTDLWWNPAQQGWGLNLLHQGQTIFLAWYTFGPDQRPMWVSGLAQRQPNGSFTGTLNRPLTGTPWPQINGTPATAQPIPTVGNFTLSFSNGETGTFTWTLDGVSQTRSMRRFEFGSPATVCTSG